VQAYKLAQACYSMTGLSSR